MIEIQPRDTSKGHFYVSMVKSAVRIAAGIAFMAAWLNPLLLPQFVGVGGFFLILAEGLGILEEMV